jgi:tetratricopeptide (TPR) repeat protein
VEVLGICRDLGDRLGQANALTLLGGVRSLTGDYPGAARDLDQALSIHRDTGNRYGEVTTLNEKGNLSRARGDFGQAATLHQRALDLARQIGSPLDEARALTGLGRCALAAGRPATDAAAALRQALGIFERIGAAEAPDVAAELRSLSR